MSAAEQIASSSNQSNDQIMRSITSSDAHSNNLSAPATNNQSPQTSNDQSIQPWTPYIPFPGHPVCIVLVYNIAKSSNIGPMTRTCVAFNVSEILLVGARKIRTHGNKDTTRFARLTPIDNLDQAVSQVRAAGFTIVGVEIGENAVSIDSVPSPFAERTCFVFGNEGIGLTPKVLKHCDRLVYIEQSGHGTASLNVTVATGIVLHAFQRFARYPCNTVLGDKYKVDESKIVNKKMWRLPKGQHERLGDFDAINEVDSLAVLGLDEDSVSAESASGED